MKNLSTLGEQSLSVAETLIDDGDLDKAESVLLELANLEEPNRRVLDYLELVYQHRLLLHANRIQNKYPDSPVAAFFQGRLLAGFSGDGRTSLIHAIGKADDDPSIVVMCHRYLMDSALRKKRVDLFIDELRWVMSLDETSDIRKGAFSFAVGAISRCECLELHQQLRTVADCSDIAQNLPLISKLLHTKADELELGYKIMASIN